MGDCRHHDVCGLSAESDLKEDFCILHSENPEKDKKAFALALDSHRKNRGDNFLFIVFQEIADFRDATFSGEAHFSGATFSGEADFFGATFSRGADFSGATFFKAYFSGAKFFGRTLFATLQDDNKIVRVFSEANIDFREVTINPLDALSFRDADLRKCRFLDTDLRKVEITGATWSRVGNRFGVYDEIAPLQDEEERQFSRIERLYRELKQNYEERRDYERAGDFHFGEKEMRRLNPDTPLTSKVLLNLYKLSSGYGERFLRPLLWAGVLLTLSTYGYLALGLSDKGSPLALTDCWDWLRASYYSFRVMILYKPVDLTPIGYARLINTAQTILGPIFIGLFALAVRQRLKR